MSTTTITWVDVAALKPLLPGSTLGAAAIDLSLVKARVQAPFTLSAGADTTLVVQAGTELELRALNEANSRDPDRIVAPAAVKTQAGELPPQVMLTDDYAWLKYRVDGRVSVKASANAAWFGIRAGASAALACSDYRRHPKDTFALAAVEHDVLAGPRFALSLEHVRRLGEGDAVAVQVSGELSAAVTLSWSDVFTSQLGTLTRALQSTSPIGIRTSVAATVTASVKVSDTFVLVWSRIDQARWRVALKKGEQRSVDFGADAGATVELDNPEEIARMLSGVLGDLLGASYDTVKALANKAGLDAGDLQRFAGVFRRLGLPEAPDVDLLRTALDRLETEVRSRLEKVVKEKVSLGFAYEYRRIAADSTLFQAVVSEDALLAHHGALTRGSLKSVAAAVQAQPTAHGGPVALETYLNEQSVTRARAYGFTLGVGKWQMTGKDRDELTVVRRQTLDRRHEQRSYAGLGAYTGTVFGETRSWQVDFAAEMPRFSVGEVPRLNEYQLGFALTYEESSRRFDEKDVEQAIDIAALWSICAPGDAEELRALLGTANEKERVDWSAHVRINDEAFRAILPVIAASNRSQFAGAMAAALRCSGTFGVRDVARRRALYEPVWAFYLGAHQQPTPREVATMAVSRLRAEEPLLARHEEQFDRGVDRLLTVAGTCALNDRTRANADDFLRGARTLAAAITRNDPDLDVLTSCYRRMGQLWNQSHHVRALGARLVDAAATAGVLKGVERTLSLTVAGESVTISSNQAGTI